MQAVGIAKETVETVEIAVSDRPTLLKQGVNERAERFFNFEFRILIGKE